MTVADTSLTGTTSDAFLGGRITIRQPLKGFRAGLDSVLLAASVSQSATRVLELGAGAGAIACCILADLPNAELTLIERQPQMLALLRDNIAANGFAERCEVVQGDLLDKKLRENSGLPANHFDTVVANPPFFDSIAGTKAPDPAKAAASHMAIAELDDWVRLAAGSLRPRGEAIFILPAESMPVLVSAFTRRFGALALLPVAPRPGTAATRILLRGTKGSRAPMTLLPPLVLHGETGNGFAPLPEAIFRGTARLVW
ncbi:MAG: methyltransferase [Hyphomicrobiaceae bacterium]|nr:methyltransferase [Hyphomicrobiaceae bacterium]